MTVNIGFYSSPQSKADTIVAAVFSDKQLNDSAEALNTALGGLIKHHLDLQKQFKGKAGQTLILSAPKDSQFSRVIVLGLGEKDKLDVRTAETIGGKLYLALKGAGASRAILNFDESYGAENCPASELAAHIAAGVKLRSYEFKKYKKNEDDNEDTSNSFEQFHVIADQAEANESAYKPLSAAIDGVYFARDLVNEPPNTLFPESFAQKIKEELKPLGVEVEILDEKKMEKLGFAAHLSVGMGSVRPPRAVVMRWNGAGKDQKEGPLAFVGKGVTFDTGGISIKPSSGMEDMKLDMAGAAAVVGAMKALALRKAKVNVVGIAGLAENMPSHMAYRPSDVINSLSGQTIEVLNTDAEGRLVLADCLTYVQRTYNPRMIVDLATLTGAMMVALGYEYCGVFANKDEVWQSLENAGIASTEKLWRMPLDEAYRKEMDSAIADIKNLGTNARYAGACTAAGFLERFIENDTPWAHMDIAGTAWVKSDTPTCPKPGTGFGVRTLDRLAASFEN